MADDWQYGTRQRFRFDSSGAEARGFDKAAAQRKADRKMRNRGALYTHAHATHQKHMRSCCRSLVYLGTVLFAAGPTGSREACNCKVHENGFFALFCKTLHFRLPICAAALPTTETPLRVCATALQEKTKQPPLPFHVQPFHSALMQFLVNLRVALHQMSAGRSFVDVRLNQSVALYLESHPHQHIQESVNLSMHTDRLCKRIVAQLSGSDADIYKG